MQITSENGFKNALIYQKLWPKQVTDRNYGHFLYILSLFWVKNMVSRGSTSHVISELIFRKALKFEAWLTFEIVPVLTKSCSEGPNRPHCNGLRQYFIVCLVVLPIDKI